MAREVKAKPRIKPEFAKTVADARPYGQQHGAEESEAGDKNPTSQGWRDCTNCGATVKDPEVEYCPQCGTPLPSKDSSASAVPGARPAINHALGGTMMGPGPMPGSASAPVEPAAAPVEVTPAPAVSAPPVEPPPEDTLPEPAVPLPPSVPEPVVPVTPPQPSVAPTPPTVPQRAPPPPGFPTAPAVEALPSASETEEERGAVTFFGLEVRLWSRGGKKNSPSKAKKPVLNPALGYTEIQFVKEYKLPLGVWFILAIGLVALLTFVLLEFASC